MAKYFKTLHCIQVSDFMQRRAYVCQCIGSIFVYGKSIDYPTESLQIQHLYLLSVETTHRDQNILQCITGTQF